MDREKRGKIQSSLAVVFFVLFALLGLFSLFWLVSLTFHAYGSDYRIYLNAYVDARAGINPYVPFHIGTSFLNHPIVLIIVRLLFLQGGLLTSLVWSFVSVIAWLACFLMASYLSQPNSDNPLRQSFSLTDIFFLILFMVYGPFLETISIGQVNTLAVFFVIASLLLSEIDRPVLAGISIGTAILIKTSPAIFLIYFLLIRRYRVVAAAIITALVLTLLSQIPFPVDLTSSYIETVLRVSDRIEAGRYNFSLVSSASQLLIEFRSKQLNTIIRLINKVVLAILLGFLAWFGWGSAFQSRRARLWLFACFQVLAVMFSPLVWYHHYVFLLFPIVLLLSESTLAARSIGLIVLTAIQLERYFEHTVVWFPWPSLFGSLLLLVSAFVFFIQTVRSRDSSAPAAVEIG